MPEHITLPYVLVVMEPRQTPAWIVNAWHLRSQFPLAAPTRQPGGPLTPHALHRTLGSGAGARWTGRVDTFVVGPRWMVDETLGFLAVDGWEIIDLDTDETEPSRQPVIGVSYAEAVLPAGELQAAGDRS